MITKREEKLSYVMIVFQIIITTLLFLATELLFRQTVFNQKEKVFLILQIWIFWGALFYKLRLGIIFRAHSFWSMTRGYLITILLGCLILGFEFEIIPFMRHIPHSREYIILFALLNFVTLLLFKSVFYYSMHFLRRKGYNSRQIIIIADSVSIPFIDNFIRTNDWGYRLMSILTPDEELKNKYNICVGIDNQECIKKYVTENPVDEIFYCLGVVDSRFDVDLLVQDSEEIGITLNIMQHDFWKDLINNKKFKGDFNNSFVTFNSSNHNYLSLKIKDLTDMLFSVLVIFVLTPLTLLIALLIKLEDGGPVLFKQERIGLNGRRFKCYKFRSMVVNAEELITTLMDQNESDGPTFKIENDPRITKIGRILRKTSMDELPQFYNVIKGEMAVIGPRPPLLKEVQQYERSQLRRLSMKPGITGSWQVWGRHEVTFKEWMQMDLDYIDHWSLWLDFKIVVATIGVIVMAKGR